MTLGIELRKVVAKCQITLFIHFLYDIDYALATFFNFIFTKLHHQFVSEHIIAKFLLSIVEF